MARSARRFSVTAAWTRSVASTSSSFNAVLIGHYRFDIVSAIQLTALAVRTALIVYFISRGHSILALAVITLAVSLPSRLAVALAARRLLPSLKLSQAHFRPDKARELFGYGRYTFIAALADRQARGIDAELLAGFNAVLPTNFGRQHNLPFRRNGGFHVM